MWRVIVVFGIIGLVTVRMHWLVSILIILVLITISSLSLTSKISISNSTIS